MDRFIPGFALFFLHGKIRGWKASGYIQNYKTSIIRKDKLYYEINIKLGFTKEQSQDKINELIAMITG